MIIQDNEHAARISPSIQHNVASFIKLRKKLFETTCSPRLEQFQIAFLRTKQKRKNTVKNCAQ